MEKEDQITIAIIDDYKGLREALVRFFERCNFKVLFEANNGQVGLDYMQKCEVVPDVCVLDVNMPVMDGFITARELSVKYPELRILAYSSLEAKRSVKEMLGAGVKGYLLKSAHPDQLKAAIVKLYEGGTYFSDEVQKFAYDI